MPSFTLLHDRPLNVTALALCPSMDLLAYTTADVYLHVVRWVTWQKVMVVELTIARPITSLTWSPDGKSVAVLSANGELAIMPLEQERAYPITPSLTTPPATIPPPHTADGVKWVSVVDDPDFSQLPATFPMLWTHVLASESLVADASWSALQHAQPLLTTTGYPVAPVPHNTTITRTIGLSNMGRRILLGLRSLFPPELLPPMPILPPVNSFMVDGRRRALPTPTQLFAGWDRENAQLASAGGGVLLGGGGGGGAMMRGVGHDEKGTLWGIWGYSHEPSRVLHTLPPPPTMLLRGLHAFSSDMYKPYIQKLLHGTVPMAAIFLSLRSTFGCGSSRPYDTPPSPVSARFDHGKQDSTVVSMSCAPAVQSVVVIIAKILRQVEQSSSSSGAPRASLFGARGPSPFPSTSTTSGGGGGGGGGGDVPGAVPFGVVRIVGENCEPFGACLPNLFDLVNQLCVVDACYKHAILSIRHMQVEWGLCNRGLTGIFKGVETHLLKHMSGSEGALAKTFYPHSPIPLLMAEMHRLITTGTATEAFSVFLASKVTDDLLTKALERVAQACAAAETLCVTHVARSVEAALLILSEVHAEISASSWTARYPGIAESAGSFKGMQPPVNKFYAFREAASEWGFLGLEPGHVSAMIGEGQHLLVLTQHIRGGLVKAKTYLTSMLVWMRTSLKHWEARRREAAELLTADTSIGDVKAPRCRGMWPAPQDMDIVRMLLQPTLTPTTTTSGAGAGVSTTASGATPFASPSGTGTGGTGTGEGVRSDPLGLGIFGSPAPPAAAGGMTSTPGTGTGTGTGATPARTGTPAGPGALEAPVVVIHDAFLPFSLTDLIGEFASEPFSIATCPIATFADLQALKTTESLDESLKQPAVAHSRATQQALACHDRIRHIIVRLKRRLQPPLTTYSAPPLQVDVPVLPGMTPTDAAAVMHYISRVCTSWYDDDTSWEPPQPEPGTHTRLIRSSEPPATSAPTPPAPAPTQLPDKGVVFSSSAVATPQKGVSASVSTTPYIAGKTAQQHGSITGDALASGGGGGGGRSAAAALLSPGIASPGPTLTHTHTPAALPGSLYDTFDKAVWVAGSHMIAIPLPAPNAALMSAGRCTSDAILLIRMACCLIEPGASRMWWRRIGGAFISLPPGTVCLSLAFYGPTPGALEVAAAASVAASGGISAAPVVPGAGRHSLIALLQHSTRLSSTSSSVARIDYRSLPMELIPSPDPTGKPQPGSYTVSHMPVVALEEVCTKTRGVESCEGLKDDATGPLFTSPDVSFTVDIQSCARVAGRVRVGACGARGGVVVSYGGSRLMVLDLEEDEEEPEPTEEGEEGVVTEGVEEEEMGSDTSI